MFRASANIVGVDAYEVGESPYVVSQVTAAAMVDLARKRARKAAAPPAPKIVMVDPEVAKARHEAAELKLEAQSRLADASAKSLALLAEAKENIEKERLQAREEAFAQGLSHGSEQGYEEGLKKGEEEGLSHWAELVSRWQGLLDATLKEKEKYLADREQILVELAIKISAKILAKELTQNPEGIRQRVKEAIKSASDKQILVVHLHPEDLARALEMDSASLRAIQGVKQIEFLADDKVVRGGLRIDSGAETIDAGMDTQLAEIAKGLLEEAFHAD